MIRLLLPALVLMLSLSLGACSMQGMADRMVPDDVMADANAVVDEVMAGDLRAVRDAFPDASGEEFEAALVRMAEEVRAGRETSREIVGVQTSARTGTDGSNRSFALAHEVATPAGYTTVSQTWVEVDGERRLATINVAGSDSSTAAQIRRIGMAGRIIGLAFLLGLAGVGLVFLRRRGAASHPT